MSEGGLASGGGLVPGLAAGSRFAGYRLEQLIGRGGMAVVFSAIDERLGRRVALKAMAPALVADAVTMQRFMRESRAAAAVDHPHIIPVYEASEEHGVLFIAMRLVPAGDVRTLLAGKGPLPAARAAAIISPVASALDAAHAAGLVHRDVKPANMLLDTEPGRPDHVYLSDFGLSKPALTSSSLTGTGQFLGTPEYAAPEQIEGEQVDGRADQYALACTAFEMLTGTPPFPGDRGMAVLWAHLSQPPPLLSERRPGMPAAADAVFGRGLAKSATDRFGTCREFADALRAALGLPPYESVPGDLPAGQRAGPHGGPVVPALEVTATRPPGRRGTTGRPSLAAADRGPPRPHRKARTWVLAAALLAGAATAAAAIVVSLRPVPARCSGAKPCVIDIGGAATALAVGGDGKTLYVASSQDGTVTPISVATGVPAAPIRAGDDPVALVLAPGGATLYVANGSSGTVTPVSTGRGYHPGRPIPVGPGPSALAVTPDGSTLYVASSAAGTITPVSTRTGTARAVIRAVDDPVALNVTPDGTTLYVASGRDGTVTPIRTSPGHHVGQPIRVGSAPRALAASPDGRWLYVANSGDGTVTPVSVATGAPGTPFAVGGHPRALVLAQDGQVLYVSRRDGTVVPVSTATGVPGAPIQVGSSAGALAVTPNGKILYAAGSGSGDVAVGSLAGVGGPTAGFQVLSMTFVSNWRGWALGTVSCPSGRCLKLLGTTDGFTWSAFTLTGLTASPASFGVCPGQPPCLQQVRFANSQIGYAFDPSLYVTFDGGYSWSPVGGGASSLESANQVVVRVAPATAGCSRQPYQVKTQAVGAVGWQLLTTPRFAMTCPPVLSFQGTRLVLADFGNPAGSAPATAQIARSESNGQLWATGPGPCGAGTGYASAVALAPPDALVVLCQQTPGPSGAYGPAWIRISTSDGARFGPAQAVPMLLGLPSGAQAQYQLAAATVGRILVSETGTHGSRLLFTNNGGRRWRATLTMPGGPPMILVGYESPEWGRIAQGSTVWTTMDGGRKWQPNHLGP